MTTSPWKTPEGLIYDSRSDAIVSVPSWATKCYTRTYANHGDGGLSDSYGGAQWVKVGSSQPSTNGWFLDSHGYYWDIADPVLNPFQFGAIGTEEGATPNNDTVAMQVMAGYGRDVFLPATIYCIYDTIEIQPATKWTGQGGGQYSLYFASNGVRDMTGSIIMMMTTPTTKYYRPFMSDQVGTGGWVQNMSARNANGSYYKLVSWLNSDADPYLGTGASMMPITCAIRALPGRSTKLEHFRVMLSFDGTATLNGLQRVYSTSTNSYTDIAPTTIGTICDYGIIADMTPMFHAKMIVVAGYWQMGGIIQLNTYNNDKTRPLFFNDGSEYCLYEDCTLQGYWGLSIRGADQFPITGVGSGWIETYWANTHPFNVTDCLGYFRGIEHTSTFQWTGNEITLADVNTVTCYISGTTLTVTGSTSTNILAGAYVTGGTVSSSTYITNVGPTVGTFYVNNTQTVTTSTLTIQNIRLRLTGITPDPSTNYVVGDNISPSLYTRAISNSEVRGGEIGSMYHTSFVPCTDLPGNMSSGGSIQISGRGLRQFTVNAKMYPGWDDVGIFSHYMSNLNFGIMSGSENFASPITLTPPLSQSGVRHVVTSNTDRLVMIAGWNFGANDFRPLINEVIGYSTTTRYISTGDVGCFNPSLPVMPHLFMASSNGLSGVYNKARGIVDDIGNLAYSYIPSTSEHAFRSNALTSGTTYGNVLIYNPNSLRWEFTNDDWLIYGTDGSLPLRVQNYPLSTGSNTITMNAGIKFNTNAMFDVGRNGNAAKNIWATDMYVGGTSYSPILESSTATAGPVSTVSANIGSISLTQPVNGGLGRLFLKTSNTPISITGSLAGGVLSISSITGVTAQVNSVLSGSGVTTATITSQLTGTTGGIGTYQTNGTQTLSTQTMALANADKTGWTEVPSLANAELNGLLSMSSTGLVQRNGNGSYTTIQSLGTPTIVSGVGAGTSPTVSIVGNMLGGRITLTTDTNPSSSSTIVTVTYPLSFANSSDVIFMPVNSNAANLYGLSAIMSLGTTSNFIMISGSTQLSASTQYIWSYHITGY